jgi:Mg2+/citrate symporter
MDYQLRILLWDVGIGILASLVGGFGLFRCYEMFLKGIKNNSKLRIWLAFSCGFFILIMFTVGFIKGAP